MVVVTNCTNRKASRLPAVTCSALPTPGIALDEVAISWTDQIRKSIDLASARDLYCGRSMVDARWVEDRLTAELYVASAGLGLVPGEGLVPNYDATISDPGNWLAQTLDQIGVGAREWWDALCRARGVAKPVLSVLRGHPGDLKFVTMPASYLRMVEHELLELGESDLRQLRIFTSPAGQSSLREPLKGCALAYDDRLDAIPGFAGTQADFPQRAMRHFVATLMDGESTLDRDRDLVEDALRPLSRRMKPARQRLADAEIKTVLRGAWGEHRGESSRLLGFLRRTSGIACEQGRFRQLWREVRAELTERTDGR